MTGTDTRPQESPARPRSIRGVLVAAWAVPVMVAGQFALLAVVPVAIVLAGSLRNPRLNALRPWAAGLAVAFATPLVLWAIGPEREQSLSKDMHPALMVVVVLAGLATAIRAQLLARRTRRPE